jgi:hypothetical protein
MKIPFPADSLITEDESVNRGKFFTLMAWSQLYGYRMPSLEWRITQYVFDDCFLRFWDNYFIMGFALGCPWRNKSRGKVLQFTWPVLTGLWFAEIGRKGVADPNCATMFWNSVLWLDSPLGAMARKIEFAHKNGQPLPAFLAFPPSSNPAETTDWVLQRKIYERQISPPTQGFFTWFVSTMLLRRTIQDIFGGSTFMHRVPLIKSHVQLSNSTESGKKQKKQGTNPDSSSTSSSNKGREGEDTTSKGSSSSSNSGRASSFSGGKGGKGSSPSSSSSKKEEEFELEIIQIRMTTRFFRWRPLRISRQNHGDSTEYFLDMMLPQVASTHLAQITLGYADMLSNNATSLAKYWWRFHLFAFRVLGVSSHGTVLDPTNLGSSASNAIGSKSEPKSRN